MIKKGQRCYFFTLSLSYLDCEQLYAAGNHKALLMAETGERIQLPTKNLRPFVQSQGIQGRFRLIINDKNKIESFDKVT